MAAGKRWTREELLIAYNLYCKIPFGKLHHSNPDIIQIAKGLGRTPSSLAMKLTNFASLDPELQVRGIKGLPGASKTDKELFQEFHTHWEDYVLESESLINTFSPTVDKLVPKKTPEDKEYFPELKYLETTEKVTISKIRIGQSFFRKMILANYDYKCAITGNPIPQLLRASHILPWYQFPEQRLNPQNGICLSALHDAAFDRRLISFDDHLRLILSPQLKKEISSESLSLNFLQYEGKPLTPPERFNPDPQFLKWHRERVEKY